MLDYIKNLKIGNTVTFKNADFIDFVGNSKVKVTDIHSYSQDDIEITLILLDEYCLGAHCIEGVEKYYLYEITETDSIENLESEGFSAVNDENDFLRKITLRDDDCTYRQSNIGAMYDLTIERFEPTEPSELAVCEYINRTCTMSHLLIERVDEELFIYHGFSIDPDGISF